jgi:uncharacterized protein YybS (DUF2232 family)
VRILEDNGERVRAMVEGARMVSIAVLFALFSVLLPGLGSMLVYLIPTPIALCVVRHELRLGIVASIAAGFMAAIIGSPIQACLIVIGFGLLGVAIGESIRANFSLMQILVYGSVVALISKLLFAGIIWMLMGQEVIELLNMALNQGRELFEAVGAPYGLEFDEVISMAALVIPGLLLGSSLLEVVVNYSVVANILGKLGTKVKKLPPFSLWRFPPRLVYGYILGLALMVVNTYYSSTVLSLIGLNLIVVMSQAFFVQGLSLSWFVADQYKLHKGLRWFLAVLGVILGVFSVIVFVGVFDSLINIRRFFQRTTSQE